MLYSTCLITELFENNNIIPKFSLLDYYCWGPARERNEVHFALRPVCSFKDKDNNNYVNICFHTYPSIVCLSFTVMMPTSSIALSLTIF